MMLGVVSLDKFKPKRAINTINQTPYSQNLAPCDFLFLFPKLELSF
uniref:Uncharacterized protein n=1 Tax=Lepeophtheirus salmonis TaxID=72036 RepID=A0A0K2SZ97_LEPSM